MTYHLDPTRSMILISLVVLRHIDLANAALLANDYIIKQLSSFDLVKILNGVPLACFIHVNYLIVVCIRRRSSRRRRRRSTRRGLLPWHGGSARNNNGGNRYENYLVPTLFFLSKIKKKKKSVFCLSLTLFLFSPSVTSSTPLPPPPCSPLLPFPSEQHGTNSGR